MKPSQYLIDHLDLLEEAINKHEKDMRSKRYLIYREGYFYTGTDDFEDVKRLCDNCLGIYKYEENNNHGKA